MTSKNKVEVRIAGKEYTLVGVESDEYLQKISLYIDKKMNEIMRMNSKLSTAMAAVLTAINVADDYFKAAENKNVLEDEMSRIKSELERSRDFNRQLADENSGLNSKNSSLQLELAKREAELSEVRNLLDKATKPKEV